MLSIIRSLVFIFALSLFGLVLFVENDVNSFRSDVISYVDFESGSVVDVPVSSYSEDAFGEGLVVSVPVSQYDFAGVVIEVESVDPVRVCSAEWDISNVEERAVC